MADRFLHHPDQRFRLSYLLGSWHKNLPTEPSADEWSLGAPDGAATAANSDEVVSMADAEALQIRLADYVGRITKLAECGFTPATRQNDSCREMGGGIKQPGEELDHRNVGRPSSSAAACRAMATIASLSSIPVLVT